MHGHLKVKLAGHILVTRSLPLSQTCMVICIKLSPNSWLQITNGGTDYLPNSVTMILCLVQPSVIRLLHTGLQNVTTKILSRLSLSQTSCIISYTLHQLMSTSLWEMYYKHITEHTLKYSVLLSFLCIGKISSV